MSQKTEFEVLAKDKAYILTVGGVEIIAMKLEGFKAIQMAGTIGLTNVGLSGGQTVINDWLTIVKDKDNLTMPYDVWVKKVAEEIGKATGSSVSGVSVASGDIKVSDFAQGTAKIGVTAEVKVLDFSKTTEQVQIEKSEDKPATDKKKTE